MKKRKSGFYYFFHNRNGVIGLCGVLLIVEGAVNLGCAVYTAMELRALDRMADAASTAALDALGHALDEAEADALNADHEGVVYNAESTEVPDDSRNTP